MGRRGYPAEFRRRADFVALSEKTPTAAAQRLIQSVDSIASRVDRAADSVVVRSRARIEQEARRVERFATRGAASLDPPSDRRSARWIMRRQVPSHMPETRWRTRSGARRRPRSAFSGPSARTERARREVDRHALILGERASSCSSSG